MLLRLQFILCALMCLAACNSSTEKDTPRMLKEALSIADNDTADINNRLTFAFQADSLAVALKDWHTHTGIQKLIGKIYLKQNKPAIARAYFFTAAGLAEKQKDYEMLGRSLNDVGVGYNDEQNYDSAVWYYLKANKIFSEHGYRSRLAENYVNLGIIYKNAGELEQAFKASSEGAKILQELDSLKELALAYTNMGNTLKDLYRGEEALYYHKLALQIRFKISDSAGIGGSWNNLANVYRMKKDYRNALLYYDSALVIKRHMRLVSSEATTLDNIGEVKMIQANYRSADDYFREALAIRSAGHDTDGILTTMNKLTRMLTAEGKLNEAKKMALQVDSMVTRKMYLKQRIANAAALSEIYMKQKQYEQAAAFATMGFNLRDSLYKSNLIDSVLLLNERNKTQQKEKKLQLSKQLQKVQHNQIVLQYFFMCILGALLILLSITVYLLQRSNRKVKQANQKIELLLKELNHRVKNNLQIVGDMLHLQMLATDDPVQASFVQSSISRVESMNIIHTLLYKDGYNGMIDMKKFIETLVSNLVYTYKGRSDAFTVSVMIKPVDISIDKAIPAGLIVNELITNIFKYARLMHPVSVLDVVLTAENNYCKLEIADNCEHWDFNKIKSRKTGLGLFLVETLVRQLKGRWSFVSNETGTIQSLEFHL